MDIHQSVNPNIPLPKTFVPITSDSIEQSIVARFESQVRLHSNRTAVQMASEQITYEVLNRSANRIAHAIIEQLGTSQQTVAIMLSKDATFPAGMLGVLKANKIIMPLDPAYATDRIKDMLSDSQAALVLANESTSNTANQYAQGACRILRVDQLDPALSTENPNLDISPDSLAMLAYTSGTTGLPKAAMLEHRSMLHAVMRYTNNVFVNWTDRVALISSTGHSAAISNVFRTLLNGATSVPYDINTQGVAGLAAWLIQQHITVYHSVPSVFRQMLVLCDSEKTFPSVRLIHLGGSTVSLRDVELYKSRFADECRMVVNLSCTETEAFCQFHVHKQTKITTNSVPVGYALEGQAVRLLDAAGQEVSAGEVGEIAVTSRYLARGYWRRPDLSAQKFIDDSRGNGARTYLTGDLGRKSPDGCLEHLGRKDSQVKVRGFRVELGEVAAALLTLDEVDDATVITQEDASGERRLVAYVATKAAPPPTVSRMRRELATRLPEYMIPSAFVILDELPLTANGKVNVNALPASGHARPNLDTPLRPPRTSTEAELTHIWEDILGISPIGIDDDFFELGGNSLLAMRLFTRIVETLQIQLPVTELFAQPTINLLAAVMGKKQRSTAVSTLVEIQSPANIGSGTKRPTFFCMHGHTGGVMDYADLSRSLGPDHPFIGVQAWAWINEAEADTTIEAMAQRYARDIRTHQPAGPYYLGGHCYGARIAYETARQLVQMGERVALLAIFDGPVPRSIHPPRVPLVHIHRITELLKNAPYWINAYWHMGLTQTAQRIRHRLRVVFNGLQDRRLHGTSPSTHRANDDLAQFPDRVKRIAQINKAAMSRYTPGSYAGHIVIFRAKRQSISQILLGMGRADLGWGVLSTGSLEIIECEGTHENLHLLPQVVDLAQQLSTRIVRN